MKRFITLDFYRGVAAIFILFRHALEFLGYNLYTSYLAVDLFYLISGFVFVPSAGDKLIAGKTDAWGVIINRFIRLYPLYFASIILSGVFYYFGAHANVNTAGMPYWQAWLISLTMGPNIFAPYFMFQINGPAWYLFVDMVGVVFLSYTYKYLKNWMLWAIVILSAIGLIYGAFHSDPRGGLDLGWIKSNLKYGFCRFTFSFTLGVLLFKILRNGFFEKQYNLPLVGFVLCAMMGLSFSIGKINHDMDAYISLFCVLILYPFLLIVGTKVDFSGILAKITDFLSPISYTIYVLQTAFITLAYYFCKLAGVTAHQTAPYSAIVLMVFMIGFSIFMNKYYDAPARAFMAKYLKPKR